MQKYGDYNFEVLPNKAKDKRGKENELFTYIIYDPDDKQFILRQSDENYHSPMQATFAAIGHITLIEQGKG